MNDGNFSALVGSVFNNTIEEMIDLDYDKVMVSVQTTIQHWSRRYLTVLGRVTIIQTLIIPTFNHLRYMYISLANLLFL